MLLPCGCLILRCCGEALGVRFVGLALRFGWPRGAGTITLPCGSYHRPNLALAMLDSDHACLSAVLDFDPEGRCGSWASLGPPRGLSSPLLGYPGRLLDLFLRCLRGESWQTKSTFHRTLQKPMFFLFIFDLSLIYLCFLNKLYLLSACHFI